jgi:hypothetical protein
MLNKGDKASLNTLYKAEQITPKELKQAKNEDTMLFYHYDQALQDIEAKIATCESLKDLLDSYARQSTLLKLMIEQQKGG